jgi:hypothetical protein
VPRADAGRYLYWSPKRVQRIASDNEVRLDVRWTKSVRLGISQGQLELKPTERAELSRLEQAERIEQRLGAHATVLGSWPDRSSFCKGAAHMEFAKFVGWGTDQLGLMHAQLRDADGARTDVVLFGSLKHMHGFPVHGSEGEFGWVSSDAPAIEKLLATCGRINASQQEDPDLNDVEYLGVAAVKIAMRQGKNEAEREDVPHTRGFTLGHSGACTWFGEVYLDIRLDPTRWLDNPELGDVNRIVVGAPLWVRTANMEAVTRYRDLRAAERRPSRWRKRRPA